MRKYKLIKEYPNSPDKGTIVTLKDEMKWGFAYAFCIPGNYLIDYPQWQELDPLFEDYNGNPIFEGDKYWYVLGGQIFLFTCTDKSQFMHCSNIVRFSTEQAAQEYLQEQHGMNKPTNWTPAPKDISNELSSIDELAEFLRKQLVKMGNKKLQNVENKINEVVIINEAGEVIFTKRDTTVESHISDNGKLLKIFAE